MTKIIGVIPARWASTRLPGKPLQPLCGKPLVQWVAERASKAATLSDVFIATDDERVRSAMEGAGFKVVMTAVEHPSGTDRIAEAIHGIDADIVVNIQGDEPLIDPGLIDEVAGALVGNDRWQMATAAVPLTDVKAVQSASVVKVVMDEEDGALFFSRSVIPFVRDETPGIEAREESLYWRHIGIYAYRRDFLEKLVRAAPCQTEKAEKLEQLRALHIGGRIKVIRTDHMGIGVDTPEDVERAEKAIREMNLA
ncbi:MAG: 3-deoxy-manno-octulosonate cytidylyltransferase [Verrucomicrobia bacterium]|nr:3-deoxy-manno-octulosonate cytidylyltransferase [Verrucomicrobiota bacterium]